MKYILLLLSLIPLQGWLASVYENIIPDNDANTPGIKHVAPHQSVGGSSSFIQIAHAEPESEADAFIKSQLLDPLEIQPNSRINRGALFHFLQSDNLREAARNKRIAYRLYGRLAKVFVQQKMYPLAMQYYFKSAVLSGETNEPGATGYSGRFLLPSFLSPADNVVAAFTNDTENSLSGDFLSLSQQDTTYQNSGLLPQSKRRNNNNSAPVNYEYIINGFNNGKPAVSYAVIIHVKQPVTGRRKSFTKLNNVGHMFITLIKYNADSSTVSRSFGFYPHKDYLLSATPLRPVTSSVFKNDAMHDWDESVGKFISEKRFKKMIRLISRYENRSYHLNENNCTDFGLYAANIAGIIINQSKGTWPFGRGNNPANAGQSILEGKFKNADTDSMKDLFVCTDGSDQ